MEPVTIRSIDDYPYYQPGPDGTMAIPGVGVIRDHMNGGRSRWLGLDEEEGPWVYINYFPKGYIAKPHFHAANRTELLMKGAILWQEPGKKPRRYDAPAFSYVLARNVYGFEVLEDSEIYVIFDTRPVINYTSPARSL